MRRRTAAIGALYLGLSAAFTAPLFAAPNATGWQDWDVHLFFHAAVLKSLVEYGQLPFWNPWYCGGNVLLQNPQVPLLTPVYPLATVMSLPLAMKINIVLHYWIGLLDLETLLPRARIAVTVLCLLGSADIVLRNRVLLAGAFVQDPVDARFHLLDGPKALVTDAESSPSQWGSPMFRALMNGRSFYRCYDVMQLARRADTIRPLIWIDGDAKIFTTEFSPNRVDFSVGGGREPSRVRLNQNFAAGWRSNAGVVEPDPDTGQPSVVLTPGETGTFSFVFVPPGLFLGCGLGLAGIGGSAYGWRRTFKLSATLKGWLPPS